MSNNLVVFIVSGACGQYSDHTTWAVAAYTDKAQADKHCQLLTDREEEISKVREKDGDYYETRHVPNPDLDESLPYDYANPKTHSNVTGPEHLPGGKYYNQYDGNSAGSDPRYMVEAIPLFAAVPVDFAASQKVAMDYLEENGLIPK